VDNGDNNLDEPLDAIIVDRLPGLHFDRMSLFRRGGLRWVPVDRVSTNKPIFSVSYLEGDTTGQWKIHDNQIGVLRTEPVKTASTNSEHGCVYTQQFSVDESMRTQLRLETYYINEIAVILNSAGIDMAPGAELVSSSNVTARSVVLNLRGIWRDLEHLSLQRSSELHAEGNAYLSEFELKSLTLSDSASFTQRDLNVSVESLVMVDTSTMFLHGQNRWKAEQFHLGENAHIGGKKGGGYGECEGPGSPSRSVRGGSHGGLGSREDVDAFVKAENSLLAYDDVFRPSRPGSGGCDPEYEGKSGHGGAYLHLNVSGWTRLDGEIDLSGSDALEPETYDEG
jgi:hypothetical protein